MATRMVRTADVLDGHVSLDLECLDRIYPNGYVPNLQVVGFLAEPPRLWWRGRSERPAEAADQAIPGH